MKLTLSLIAVNVIFFILQIAGLIGKGFAFMPALFAAQPYTILTSMFMHSGIHHLMLNMLGLFTFGSIVEKELGERKMLVLYFFAGLFGSFGYMLFGDSLFIPALGASGAIFGLMGAAAVLKPKLVIWTPYGPFPMLVAAFFWGAAEFFSGSAIDNVAHSAHIFGLISGVIFTALLLKKLRLRYAIALVGLPIVLMFVFSGAVPSEISNYNPELEPCYVLNDSIIQTNFKAYQYSCLDNQIVTATKPNTGKLNIAYYNETLPVIVESFYESMFGTNCTAEIETVDFVNNTVTATGKICSYDYAASASICRNVEVNVVKFTKERQTPELIDCTKLQ